MNKRHNLNEDKINRLKDNYIFFSDEVIVGYTHEAYYHNLIILVLFFFYFDIFRLNTEIELEVKTEHPDAILVWFGTNPASDDYLGLGLDDGLVKVIFDSVRPSQS